jgi:organic hydroperoxide reductase OsmC/OhrA
MAVLGLALSLTACANETDQPASGSGLADAKTKLLSVQDQIVELVPGNVVSFYDSPETLRVAGYSACFDLPEYEYGEKY